MSLGRCALLLGLVFVPACTIEAVAPKPSPNVIAHPRFDGSFQLDLSEVPKYRTCSEASGLKDFCVDRFRGAFDEGLKSLLGGFFRSGSQTYKARFKLSEFSHTRANGVVVVSLRWQFVLSDASGRSVVELAESTTGPKTMGSIVGGDDVVGALINATLERIGKALNESSVEPTGAAPPPAT